MAAPKTHQTVDWNAYEVLHQKNPANIVWASTGGDGSGKSFFGLTAPEPIFVCAFDAYGMNRVGRIAKQHLDGTPKDIRIARYPFTPREFSDDKKKMSVAANKVWEQFVADYRMALQHARTILWDREDVMWELLRFASFGEQSAAPKEYGDLNMEYVSLIQEAFAAKVNLGILRGVREEWLNKFDAGKGKMVPYNTGKMIPDGMKKIQDHVDITLTHRWDPEGKAFATKVGKFTNPEYKDTEHANLDFLGMAMMAYPEIDVEEWGVIV
jgi:hypothetical protein